MTREEIERGFVDAGWELDGGFSGYLIIGENGNQSILVHRWTWETEDPVFELSSRERDLTYWVREIPTPHQAGNYSRSTAGRPRRSGATPTSRASRVRLESRLAA